MSEFPPSGSAGVVAAACVHTETWCNTGSPDGGVHALQPATREGQAGPSGVSERPIVPQKLGNASGGKGPSFKGNARSGESLEIGR